MASPPKRPPGKVASLAMSFDPTPIKKSKKGNLIDVVQTKVSILLLGFPTRSDVEQAPYMKPFTEAFETDESGKMGKQMRILSMPVLKGEKGPNGEFMAKPKAPGSKIPWEAFVLWKKNDNESAKDVGQMLADGLTAFVNDCPEYSSKIPFVLNSVSTANPQSLNTFLLDKDVAAVLKHVYKNCTKAQLAKDDNAMQAFFGSTAEGARVLHAMPDHVWLRL